jgi:UDP-glucose 4-epimerase
MKVLVTGAAGFMGSHLVDGLIGLNHEVYGVDDLSGGFLENVNPKSRFEQIDLRNKAKAAKYISEIKPEIIFHLAADATEGRSQFTPISATERNYLAYLNILVPAIRSGVKKVVLTSSMSVYGKQKPPFSENMEKKPEDMYGVAKAAMESATQILSDVHGFKYVIIRPHNVYGPRQNLSDPYRNVLAIFINCLMNDRNYYIYGKGNQKRAFSYIDDFTPYIIKAAFLKQAENQIFNLGPDKEYSINHVSDLVLKTFFGQNKIPARLRPKYLSIRPKEIINAWCTVDKAEKILGYKNSVTIEEGIRIMVDWAKSKGPQKFKHLQELELTGRSAPKVWTKKLI